MAPVQAPGAWRAGWRPVTSREPPPRDPAPLPIRPFGQLENTGSDARNRACSDSPIWCAFRSARQPVPQARGYARSGSPGSMCARSAIRPFRPHGSRLASRTPSGTRPASVAGNRCRHAGYRRPRPRHRFPPKPAARSSRSRTPPNQAVEGIQLDAEAGAHMGSRAQHRRSTPQCAIASNPSHRRPGQASRQERGCRLHPAPAPAPPRQREIGLAPPPRQTPLSGRLLCPSRRVQTPPQTALLGCRKNYSPNRPPNRPKRTPNATFFYKITTPVAGPPT